MELSHSQLHALLKRFPSFELSYETITHKKVLPPQYDIALAVPAGRKYFLWFTFYRTEDVCYLMELNKDRRIVKATLVSPPFSTECSIETILYGTMVQSQGFQGFTESARRSPEFQGVAESIGRSKSAIFGRDEVSYENPLTPSAERPAYFTIFGRDKVSYENDNPVFVVEDIYYYKGVQLKQHPFYDRLCFLKRMFEQDFPRTPYAARPEYFTVSYENILSLPTMSIHVALPFFWLSHTNIGRIPDSISTKLAYTVHHIQYRDLYHIRPYINVPIGLKDTPNSDTSPKLLSNMANRVSAYVPDYKKPQYRYPAIFRVMADLQYDIYHLYARGEAVVKSKICAGEAVVKSTENIYYDVAYIPNYQKSVFMNGLFRNIRENKNLDYIEESDDEDEFENTRLDKHVDLTKEVLMECSFHTKFKRWVPIRVAEKREKPVPIHKL
jgi:hypothetical protein